jgi:ubiquinone/menaquinone biosynthesis C-methylase UbiE
MQDFQSTYNVRRVVLSFEEEMERLKLQASMGWQQEFRHLQWFGLQSGMRVLELGSGPGFVTERLLDELPDSLITALEIDGKLLDYARTKLLNRPNLEFVQASVMETGLPDGMYDFAIARLLFLHLHHPLAAAREIYRVLKPGGKLVIIDLDDGIFGAVQPDLEALPSILRKVAASAAERGGNRLIGRSLPRLLAQAGFADVDIDAVIQHSDLHGIEGFQRQFDSRRFAGFRARGIITEEEFEQLCCASEQLGHSSDAYAMMVYLLACGTKPQT